MHPYSLELDPDVLFAVAALAIGYVLALRVFPAPRWRRAAFAASMALLLLAFETPLERLALHYLLSAHLLQNVVAAEWAPGLAVLALPPALAAAATRHPVARALTHPLVALPLWLATYFLWHVPALYDAALRHPATLLHLEHAAYFWTGVLMWWPVIHGRISSGAKAAYVFVAFVLVSPLGLLLALLPRPAYDFYATAPRVWGLSRLTDQQIAGVTMAGEQAIVFFAVFAAFFSRFLGEEEARGLTSGSR